MQIHQNYASNKTHSGLKPQKARNISFTGLPSYNPRKLIKMAEGLINTRESIKTAETLISAGKYDTAITGLIEIIKVRQDIIGEKSKHLIKPLKLLSLALVKRSEHEGFNQAMNTLQDALKIESYIDKIKIFLARGK